MPGRDFGLRPTLNGVPLSGDALPEDTFAESAALTSYPEGVSSMRISATANWFDTGSPGSVLTTRTGASGSQIITTDAEDRYFREWVDWIDPPNFEWSDEYRYAYQNSIRAHTPAPDDEVASGWLTDFQIGFTFMEVSTTAGWPVNGYLLNYRSLENSLATSVGYQVIVSSSTMAEQRRKWNGSSWDAWYSVAQTASQILTAVKTVDGTGSGLDADLLDGSHASAFSLTSHGHALDDLSDVVITSPSTGQVLKRHSNGTWTNQTDATGAGGSGGSGEATLDFGAFPGKTDTTLAVTGQTEILAGSLVEAWVFPEATVEHSADEHWVESIRVFAGSVVAATGFTIYGRTEDKGRLYGRYNVAWRWA